MVQCVSIKNYFNSFFFFAEAKKVGEGFCYKKLNSKTGECKSKMKDKHQKVDCCSNGGAGWSARRKDRTKCEPCKTTAVGIHHISFMSFYMGLETRLDSTEICLTKICYEMSRRNGLTVTFETKTRPCLLEPLVLLKVDAK